jgi:DNA-binding transcriptional ArsR family regulator
VPRFLVSGDADLLAIRFARSPVWETHEAVRSLVDERSALYHGPWRQVVAARAAALDLEDLYSASGLATGWVPDFLTPPPVNPTPNLEAQLAEVRRTPVEQVVAELERCRANPGPPERRERLERLIADPRRAREVLADQLRLAWDALVAPFWPRISALIDADVDHHSRRLARGGLSGMLADLHPDIRWLDGAIDVAALPDAEVELSGRGLVLMPSAYIWPAVVAISDEPWQPTVVYPARGVGELWAAPTAAPRALERLLGRSRARLLVSLDQPASTTTLAVRLGRSASGISAHLSALRGVGLVRSSRRGHEVRYARTRLGEALVRAGSASGDEEDA